jgi:hypothetical protein
MCDECDKMCEPIVLSERDFEQFMKIIQENRPPNAKLREAMKRYKEHYKPTRVAPADKEVCNGEESQEGSKKV